MAARLHEVKTLTQKNVTGTGADPRRTLGPKSQPIKKMPPKAAEGGIFYRRWSALYENEYFFKVLMIMISGCLDFYLFLRLCRSSP